MSYRKDMMHSAFEEIHYDLIKDYNEKIRNHEDFRFRIFDFKGMEYHLFVIAIKYELYIFARWYFERNHQGRFPFRFETIPLYNHLRNEVTNHSTLEWIVRGEYTSEKSELLKTIIPHFSEKNIHQLFSHEYRRRDNFYTIPLIQKFMDWGYFNIVIWMIREIPYLQKNMSIRQSISYEVLEYHLYYRFISTFLFSTQKIIEDNKAIIYPFFIEEIIHHLHDIEEEQLELLYRVFIADHPELFDCLYQSYPHIMYDNFGLYWHFMRHVTKNKIMYEKYIEELFEWMPITFTQNLIMGNLIRLLFDSDNCMSILEIESYIFILLSKMKNSFRMTEFFTFEQICSKFFQEPFIFTKYFDSIDSHQEYYEKIYIRGIETILSYQMLDSYSKPIYDYDQIYRYMINLKGSSEYKTQMLNICLNSFKMRYSLSLSLDAIQKIVSYY